MMVSEMYAYTDIHAYVDLLHVQKLASMRPDAFCGDCPTDGDRQRERERKE